jgi:putative transposase
MLNSTEIRRGRTCVFLLHVHLVFVTKYRRSVSTSEIFAELKDIFASVCQDFEARLVECDGKDDHVYLLVNYPPKIAISSLVNSLKGVSARLLRKKKYPSVQRAL